MFSKFIAPFSAVLLTALSSAALPNNPTVDARATAALQKMTDHLKNANTMTIRAHSILEEVSDTNEKVQHEINMDLQVKRPNKIFGIKSGYENFSFWLDSGNLTVLDTQKNKFSRTAVPSNLDVFLDETDKYNIDAPFADLLYSDALPKLLANVVSGRYLGLVEVGGIPCHQLAFRQENVDWQIWVADGEKPFPVKITIVSKMVTGSPEFTLVVDSFDTGMALQNSLFSFAPPKGASEEPFKLADKCSGCCR